MAYTEDDVAMMASRGRAPSYNARGQVRGFRTRPGAPQANTNQNLGALGLQPSSITPQGVWDQMFRNRVTGETPSSLAAKRNAPAPSMDTPDSTPDYTAPDTTDTGSDGFSFGMTGLPKLSIPKIPSLEDLSSGPSHAKLWSSPAISQAAPMWNQTVGGSPQLGSWLNRSVRSKYGWGSSVI